MQIFGKRGRKEASMGKKGLQLCPGEHISPFFNAYRAYSMISVDKFFGANGKHISLVGP